MRWIWPCLYVALLSCGACAQIAGIDGDYVVDGEGGSATGTATGNGGGVAGTGGDAGSGGAGTGTASGTGTGTASGTGGGLPEDCLDGVDNDGNQLVDCEDPLCQSGYECVPEVPTGWLGIYRLATAQYPVASPACPNGDEGEIYFEGLGDAATCSSCSCGSAQNGDCTLPTMSCYEDSSSCSTSVDVTSPADTNCHDFPYGFLCSGGCSSGQKCQISSQASLVGSPSCPASGGAVTLPDMWQQQHDVCHYDSLGAGCGSGMVCVAKGAAPYDDPACVIQADAGACPAGWTDEIHAYADANDTRDCSDCTCSAQGLSCTGGMVTVYNDNGCGGSNMSVSGTSCHEVGDYTDDKTGSYRVTAATVSGTCTAAGGDPIGAVEPTNPTRICCLP